MNQFLWGGVYEKYKQKYVKKYVKKLLIYTITPLNMNNNYQLYEQTNPLYNYCNKANCDKQISYQKDKRFNTSRNITQISNAMRYSQLVNKRTTPLVNNLSGGINPNSTVLKPNTQNGRCSSEIFRRYY